MTAVQRVQLQTNMRFNTKVVTLLFALGAALVVAEEAEDPTPTVVEDDVKQPDTKDTTATEEEGSTKTPEKRGLFRMTGVHGENPQFQYVYTPVPQQNAAASPVLSYQQPQALPLTQQYEPRLMANKYEQLYMRPMPYNNQHVMQQQYFPSPSMPFPYSAPAPATTMVLLMTPPHPGNPYGSLMLLPVNSIIPQYTPNNIVPYNAPPRVPIQFVPQYIPVASKGYSQNAAFPPVAHYKGAEYSQKPAVLPTPSQYQQYQEQPSSSEEQDPSTVAPSPSVYGNRARPSEQYVKGG